MQINMQIITRAVTWQQVKTTREKCNCTRLGRHFFPKNTRSDEFPAYTQ